MARAKTLKRATRAIWDRVKALRTEYKTSLEAEALDASANALGQCAEELHRLAAEKRALDSAPPTDAPRKRKRSKKPVSQDETA